MIRPLKFELKRGLQEIKPNGQLYGRPTIAFQGNGGIKDLRMWAAVDDSVPAKSWLFYVAQTGEALPEGYYFEPLGSAMTPDFSYVVHLYRLDKKE